MVDEPVACSKQMQVPAKRMENDLPLSKLVMVALARLKKGEVEFGRGMGI